MGRILKIQKKENGPRASSAPALELNTIIFIHVYWYMQQISGERLQDHWSSGCLCENKGADHLLSINCKADLHLCFHQGMVQFLFISSLLSSFVLVQLSSVCVRPGWKPRRPVFSWLISVMKTIENDCGHNYSCTV